MMDRRKAIAGLGALGALAGCAAFTRRRQFLGGVEISRDATIAEALLASPEHSEFLAGLDRAGVTPMLEGFGPMTIFAPSNAGLARTRPKGLAARIVAGEDQALLLNHIVTARVDAEEIRNGAIAIGGRTLLISEGGAVLRLTNTTPLRILDQRDRACALTETDVRVSNGIIHSLNNAIAPAV